ncbi:HdeD family acid-resistance protein [Achromobacter insolitus]|uniref:HdeD family acid-resistance protein n=1 Tax=Achromobacter insolitus TaxID=217204 RepID=UPI0013E31CB0|nr:HdeD family acid-resistance protein [Achromobacter insolitus]NGT16242.1 HdeD family acid-resistance protein [Achromobacter insolitus]
MLEQQVVDQIGRHWGWVALRGVVAILFGLMALLMPAITLSALVLVWGAFALVDGVLALVAGVRIRDNGKPLWALIVVGLLGIAAGIVTFVYPGLTALVLLYIIAIWALVSGVFQIVAAIRFRKDIRNEWLLGLSGLVSILFGGMMIMQPGAGALALVWVIGLYAVFFGILLVVFSFRLKQHKTS